MPISSLHRTLSHGSQWSASDTPQHHHQGTSYHASSSTSSTPSTRSPPPLISIRSPSVHSTRLRSTSASSSHAIGHTHRRDVLGVEDEGNVDEEDEDDTGSISPSLARRGKGIATQEDTAEDGEGSGGEDDPITVKERQSLINVQHPFGLPIWKPALYKKSRSLDRYAEQALHLVPSAQAERHLLPGNIFWVFFFGWWISLVCVTLSAVLYIVPRGGKRYASLVYGLGWYLVWPFGKYVEGDLDAAEETNEDVVHGDAESIHEQDTIRGSPRTTASDHPDSMPTIRGVPLTEEPTLTPDTYNAHYASAVSWSSDTPGEATHLLRPYGSSSSKTYGTGMLARSLSITSSIGVAKKTGSDLVGKVCFWIAIITIIAPLMLFVCLICWGLVFTIPMARLNWALLKHLFSHPASIRFCAAPVIVMSSNQQEPSQDTEAGTTNVASAQAPQFSIKHTRLSEGQLAPSGSPTSTVLLCTYRAVGLQYYKYTVGGVNILFINLLPVVFFVIFDGMVLLSIVEQLEHEGKHVPAFLATIASRGLIFVLSLLSVIPLSYFIGMAVASISAQSSIGMGAVINATFGSIIEIILYAIALTQGKGRLVEGSIIGSLLAGVLLMPGISMASGALRHKEQRFNAKSAGVTSMMLIMAIIGALAPTLFYQTYGNARVFPEGCPTKHESPGDAPWICDRCYYQHPDPATDPFYQSTVKTLMYFCAFVLLFSYLIGLWFSLHTHASQIWQNPGPLLHPMEIPRDRTSVYHRIAPSGHPPSTSQRPPLHPKPSSTAIPIPHDDARPHSTPIEVPLTRQESAQSVNGAPLSPSSYPCRVSLAQSPLPQFAPILETVNRTVKATGQVPQTMTTDDFTRAVAVATVSALRHQQAQSHSKPRGHEEAAGGHGHDAPSWSRTTSASVLLACTALYAVIAELLVDVVDVILQDSGIDEKFLGVTLFALVPNTTEFMNAISFALNNNIALRLVRLLVSPHSVNPSSISMEIGSAYALQVCLLQIPAMVAFSAWYNPGSTGEVAKSFTYLVLVSGFYFAPPMDVDVDGRHFTTNSDTRTFSSLTLWQYLRWYITSLW
ncbi:hypothetical protein C0995_000188 [Termitomyces sp. Mi166|nr:hypothetical protein C0995_000188 [Termitomyces sp. Mi166\